MATQNDSYPESLIYIGSTMPSVKNGEVLLDIINMSTEKIKLNPNVFDYRYTSHIT